MSQSMYWPEGQIFPTFGKPIENMDAYSPARQSREMQIVMTSLQGIVNAKEPRIYMIDARADEGAETWAKTFGLTYTKSEPIDLLKEYASEAAGWVIYSTEKSEHYINLACSVAAPRKGLPITAELLKAAEEAGVTLPVLVDLTDLEMTTAEEIYTYLYKNYWKDCTHRLILSQAPGNACYLRDLAAATGAATVFCDCRHSEAEKKVYRLFLDEMEPGKAIATGWYTEERSGITTATSAGLSTVPADYFANATVYGQREEIRIRPIPAAPKLENKMYIAMFVSDGDNIQYVEHYMRKFWDMNEASRGKVAVNWTISPSLADTAPGMMNYYYDHSTEKDCFVSGPSGLGYAMPCNTLDEDIPADNYVEDEEKFAKYVEMSNRYFERTGLKVVTIWDNLTESQREIYVKNAPSLCGLTVQLFTEDKESMTSVHDGKTVKQLTPCYTTAKSHLAHVLNREADKFDGSAPMFVAAQMSVWGSLTITDLADLEKELSEKLGGKAEFVRADHFFTLMNEANAAK